MKDESIIKCPACGLILYKDDSVWHDAVKDPPKNGEYLCIVPNGDYELLTWNDNKWFAWENVFYWMPLPEPPKESEG
jgi:hypothetical protein